jgi:hypothetical protein
LSDVKVRHHMTEALRQLSECPASKGGSPIGHERSVEQSLLNVASDCLQSFDADGC